MIATETRKSAGRDEELAAARREHREARTEWKQLAERQARLRAGWIVDENGAERKIERDTERVAAADDLAASMARVAHRVERAADRLLAAKVAQANDELGALAARHDETALVMDARREALDEAWAQLVACAWRYDEARRDEQGVARRMLGAAKAAVRSDEESRDLVQRGEHHAPVRLDLNGVTEVVARPARGLFRGEADPSDARTWAALGEIVVAGRRRGLGLIGRVLREHVTASLERLERT